MCIVWIYLCLVHNLVEITMPGQDVVFDPHCSSVVTLPVVLRNHIKLEKEGIPDFHGISSSVSMLMAGCL